MKDSTEQNGYGEYENLAYHPWNVMLVFVLIAISMLFLGVMAAFVYTRVEHGALPIGLPWPFFISTLLLLGCSWMLRKAKGAFEADDAIEYGRLLVWVLRLTFIFLVFQLAGWGWLLFKNIDLRSGQGAAYLYVLSGLHFAHVLFGIPFLALFIRHYRKRLKSHLDAMVYFADPAQRLRLRLLSMYWHFLDGLWLLLMGFFIVNYLIS